MTLKDLFGKNVWQNKIALILWNIINLVVCWLFINFSSIGIIIPIAIILLLLMLFNFYFIPFVFFDKPMYVFEDDGIRNNLFTGPKFIKYSDISSVETFEKSGFAKMVLIYRDSRVPALRIMTNAYCVNHVYNKVYNICMKFDERDNVVL